MLASSVGIVVNRALSGSHLPNSTNPDPNTFTIITLQRDYDVTETDWFRMANSTGMFGNRRQLLSGMDAVPFARSVNVSGIGRCVILLDFSAAVLSDFLDLFVAGANTSVDLFDTVHLPTISTQLPANRLHRIPIFDPILSRFSSRIRTPWRTGKRPWLVLRISWSVP